MSGDVQPRKRRDKKKKKDEGEESSSSSSHQQYSRVPSVTPIDNDDVNIHVHNDHGTGGGICAKFVFFILLSALAVLIGLIITEQRGLTNLDTVVEKESRFAQIFEGWVDNAPADHDDHHGVHIDEHDEDHDDEEDEHDDHGQEDEEHEDHDDENDDHDDHDDEAVEDQEEEDSAQHDEDDEEINASDEQEQQEEDEDHDEDQDDDEDDEDEADDDVSETAKSQEDEEAEDEAEQGSEAQEDEKSEEANADDDDDDHDDKSEQEEDDEDQEQGDADAGDEEDKAEDDEDQPIGDEQRQDDQDSTSTTKTQLATDLSRRNTIVVPPKVEEIEPPPSDEEYSEEEIDDEEEITFQPEKRHEYQSLRSTYERSLTPDSERELNKFDYDDDEGEDEQEDQIEDEEEEQEEEEDPEPVEEYEAEYDDEEEEEELEAINDDDDEHDEELMKKLEAKYGKLKKNESEPEPEMEDEPLEDDIEYDDEEDDEDDYQWQQSTKRSGEQAMDDVDSDSPRQDESRENVEEPIIDVQDDDFLILDQLDEAQENINTNAALALKQFNQLVKTNPKSARALHGRAQSLDALAETKQSNQLLQQAIDTYLSVLYLENVSNALFISAADRCINRLRFLGHYARAIKVHKLLINKFPQDIKYHNQLAVTYLTTNRINDARTLIAETLKRWPADGFALVHYGFILKVNDNNLPQSIDYLSRGIATGEDGVLDGRFYFHLGDALTRLGRSQEAMSVYSDGVAKRVFLSLYQRSLYNVPVLTGRPWWQREQMPQHYQEFFKRLESNYLKIRNEGIAVLNERGYFQDEAENLRDSGEWKQFELFARGVKHKKNCVKCPVTCALVETLTDAVSCRRGQVKFSVMHPGTHVWPHCGPTNCRLRVHLGLKVPPNTFIRVANDTRSWENGRIIIFDDSFEHEVWHNGSEYRLVLIVDLWHPELTAIEKRSLSAI